MKIAINAFVFGMVLLSANSAYADCRSIPYNFNFSANPILEAESVTDGATCTNRFSTRGNVAYTDSSIVRKPKNGNLEHINITSFDYTPKKGFKGKDDYTIKVCSDKGCATITYKITVN